MRTLLPGSELFVHSTQLDRARLIRYAGASGDFNPIHWNQRVATEVGLPGVIAHGMLTMGLAAAALSDYLEGPGRIQAFTVRFSRPIVVPDPGTVEVSVSATVAKVEEDGVARVDLRVSVAGEKVLGKAQALVAPLA